MITPNEAEYQSDAGFTKDTPYLALTGELWGVFCEYLWQKTERNKFMADVAGHWSPNRHLMLPVNLKKTSVIYLDQRCRNAWENLQNTKDIKEGNSLPISKTEAILHGG